MARTPVLGALLALLTLGNVQPVVAAERGHEACLAAIAAEERRRPGLPLGLLHAIAMVESAYRPDGASRTVAWPWAVNSPAGSFYFDSRREAVAKVEALQRDGIQNIDVGCMQVNLYHHPDAFSSLDAAFDPNTNVRYAARFLRDLERAAPSLFVAVGRYHSHTPDLSEAYAERVYARWGKTPDAGRSRHGLGTPASPRIVQSFTATAPAPRTLVSPSSYRPLTATNSLGSDTTGPTTLRRGNPAPAGVLQRRSPTSAAR